MLGWIQEHILVASLGTAAVLFAISLTLMLQPFHTNEPLRMAPLIASNGPVIQTLPGTALSVAESDVTHASHSPATVKQTHEPPSMASLELPAENPSDAIGPVSLGELSAPELESVLHSLNNEK